VWLAVVLVIAGLVVIDRNTLCLKFGHVREICGNFSNKQINSDFRIVEILPKMEIWLGLVIRSYEPR